MRLVDFIMVIRAVEDPEGGRDDVSSGSKLPRVEEAKT
jgi:hypothetical protein